MTTGTIITYPVCESYFATKETKGKFFLQWDRHTGKFHFGINTPGSPVLEMQNDKYKYAKTQKEARKLAAEFFAEQSESEEDE